MFIGHVLWKVLAGAAAASLTVTGLSATSANAQPTVTPTGDAVALGRALASDVSWVSGASFVTKAGASSAALVSGGVAGMPTSGPEAVLLSTGDTSLITTPNTSGSSGSDLGGSSVRGNSDYDVTILRVDL